MNNKTIKKIGLFILTSSSMLVACNKNKTKNMSVEEETVKIKNIENKKLNEKELLRLKKEAYLKAKNYAIEQKLSEGKIYSILIATDIENYPKEVASYAISKLEKDDIDWVANAKYQIEQIKERDPEISDDYLFKLLTEKDQQYFTEVEARQAMGTLEEDKKDKEEPTKETDSTKNEEESTENTEENQDETENVQDNEEQKEKTDDTENEEKDENEEGESNEN